MSSTCALDDPIDVIFIYLRISNQLTKQKYIFSLSCTIIDIVVLLNYSGKIFYEKTS